METEEMLIERIRELVGHPDLNLVAAVQQALVDRDVRIGRLARECENLSRFLDGFSGAAKGETLRERMENLVRHYATQLGRWAARPDPDLDKPIKYQGPPRIRD